jgi:hypothetical protein
MKKTLDLTHALCQEASVLSVSKYIPCGKPATKIVWHNKDGRAYAMCDACAYHNINNRGGIELVPKII